jgi:hypothetical protein
MALTKKQQQMLAEMESKQAEAKRYTDVAGNPWFRTALQGASFGWSEEVEAAVRSLLPETMGGGEYEQIRDELRTKLSAYKEANPNSALTLELVGALVPSLLTLPFGGAGVAATTARVAPTMAKVAGRGAVEGAVTGAGMSEADTVGGMASDAATGLVTGAVLNPAMTVGGRSIAGGAKAFTNFVRTKMGDKASNAVQAELLRLQEQTGKSLEEIIFDLQEGRLMSDNKTLTIALKNMVNQGGKSGKFVLDQSKARAGQTREDAMQSLRSRLAPSEDENVLRQFKKTEDQLKAERGKEYERIYQGSGVLPEELVNQTTSAIANVPSAVSRLEKIYGAQGKISPYSVVDGKIVMNRTPTLEDVEGVRRALREEADSLYKSGESTLATIIKQKETSLRGSIDTTSKELGQTRANYAEMKAGTDTFKIGQKALSADVEEIGMVVDQLKNKPYEFNAFKAGLMNAIKNRLLNNTTTLSKLADQDSKLGYVLRTVFQGEDIADLERKLITAGDTAEIAQKMPSVAGSPTQPLKQEAARSGSMGSLADAGRVMSGDPTVLVDLLGRLVKRQAPNLSDAERLQVAQTLFSSNPELVQKALTDQTALSELIGQVGRIVSTAGAGVRTGLQQQATQETTGLIDRIRGGQ